MTFTSDKAAAVDDEDKVLNEGPSAHCFHQQRLMRKVREEEEDEDDRGRNNCLHVVARNVFLFLLNCSAWPCLSLA